MLHMNEVLASSLVVVAGAVEILDVGTISNCGFFLAWWVIAVCCVCGRFHYGISVSEVTT